MPAPFRARIISHPFLFATPFLSTICYAVFQGLGGFSHFHSLLYRWVVIGRLPSNEAWAKEVFAYWKTPNSILH